MRTSDLPIFREKRLMTVMSTTVLSLRRACRPNAILRRVSSVIVYTLNTVFGRGASPHVGNKTLKAKPAITHSNTAITIVVKPFSIWAATSGFHGVPYGVFRDMAKSVGCMFANCVFGISITPARDYVARYNAVGSNGFSGSASATTIPVSSALGVIARQDSEKRKGFTSKVFKHFAFLCKQALMKVCASPVRVQGLQPLSLDTGVSVS